MDEVIESEVVVVLMGKRKGYDLLLINAGV
jgi:hypothetical protein